MQVVWGSFGDRLGVVLRTVRGADKKEHLIEAAPFGRLDQMLRKSERRPKNKYLIEATLLGRLNQMLRTAVRGVQDPQLKMDSPGEWSGGKAKLKKNTSAFRVALQQHGMH